MSAEPAVSGDLLRDSEATLRLADALLRDMHQAEQLPTSSVAQIMQQKSFQAPASQPSLLRAYGEIIGALDSLRRYRGVLERATVDRVQRTQEKLREVTSATEMAATSLLDGLDRAVGMVGTLDDLSEGGCSDERAREVRDQLRDELFGMMGHMQFQDITSQQLQYASAVLGEVEARLAAVASLFGGTSSTDAPASIQVEHGVTFDPAATLFDADARQAVADDVFTSI